MADRTRREPTGGENWPHNTFDPPDPLSSERFIQTERGLILGSDIGLSLNTVADSAVSTPSQYDFDVPRESIGYGTYYQPIPSTADMMRQQALETVIQLVEAENVSPWATAEIKQHFELLGNAPYAAYALSNPDFLPEIQAAYWTQALAGFNATIGEDVGNYDSITDPTSVAAKATTEFFKKTENLFSADERNTLINILAAIPTAKELLAEHGITEVTRKGWSWLGPLQGWAGTFMTGLDTIRQAPEAIKPLMKDPRGNLVALMTAYLGNNPLQSYEDREKFFQWVISTAKKHIEDIDSTRGGFFAFAQQTVGLGVDVVTTAGFDALQRWVNPDQYAYRQFLSIGQNAALNLGFAPGSQAFSIASGTFDGVVQVVGDPNNLAFGFGTAMKNAAQIPRFVSRAEALKLALNPFGGKELLLPVTDRGLLNRFFYAVLSKDVDTLLETPKMVQHLDWIAKTDSAARITERFPRMFSEVDHVADLLAGEKTVKGVRHIMKAALTNPDLLVEAGEKNALRAAEAMASSVFKHREARASYLAEGGKLSDLALADEAVHASDILRPATNVVESVEGSAPRIFEIAGELNGSGEVRYLISQHGFNDINRLDVAEKLNDLQQYLLDSGHMVAAVQLGASGRFSSLNNEAFEMVMKWGKSVGADILYYKGEVVPLARARKAMFSGIDEIGEAIDSAALSASRGEMINSILKYNEVRHKWRPETLFVKELPSISWTKRARMATSTKGTGSFMAGLRRQGFRMTHRLPGRISLTNTGEGSRALHDWAKALGATDDLAAQFADKFRKATMDTRRDVVLEALQRVGEQIDDPLLRHGLVTFGEKNGKYTYFFDRNGMELGLGNDGSINPMTISHFTPDFVMPDARTLLQSVKRAKGAKGPLPHFRRGILNKTKKAREDIVKNLIGRSRRRGLDVTTISAEDFAIMAYADLLGSASGTNRATALGYMNKVAQIPAKAYRVFHNTFVIGQLAGRAIPWATKFLLEETVRSDVMSMPSLWRQPTNYVGKMWDASAIRKLPELYNEQAKTAEILINNVFSRGRVDWAELAEIMPDADRLLRAGNVDLSDVEAVRAFTAHLVGKELRGETAVDALIGSSGNVTRRAWREKFQDEGVAGLFRRRTQTEKLLDEGIERAQKISRIKDKMKEYGLRDAFTWEEDGIGIANRGFHHTFTLEAEAATDILEYSTTGMTRNGRQQYGRGYGRQMFQQIHDPIVGTYGFSRAIADATGMPHQHNGANLVASSLWNRIRHRVDDLTIKRGITFPSEIEMADWYLDNIVDEVVATLFHPLSKGDRGELVRILQGLKGGGSVNVRLGDVDVLLDAGSQNYEKFVRGAATMTEDAYLNGIMLPQKISGYFDPRFGQEESQNMFRRATDWTMDVFGEKSTQYVHRQPAYLATHQKYYQYYKQIGWDDKLAQSAAAAKATELINYVFFDNQNISTFLKDMNGYVPFFSAMWEVGSTWLYKIPSQNILPVGYAQMVRRISRTLNGLINAGLVERQEDGSLLLKVDSEMANAPNAVTAGMGKMLHHWLRAPVTIAEWIGGVGKMVVDVEHWPESVEGLLHGQLPERADLSALVKDGFSLPIGHPLDFQSQGIMAVNQFSMGLSPMLQLPASIAANAVFAQSDRIVDIEAETLSELIIKDPDLDVGRLVHYNADAFIEANGGKEAFNRALQSNSYGDLKVPDHLRIPESSLWETLIDNTFFPFGKIQNGGEMLTAVIPAATEYIFRGLFQMFDSDESNFLGMMFGQLSNYQVASEVITQLQMLEATEGRLSKAMELSTEIQRRLDGTRLQIMKDPDGNDILADPTLPGAAELQALLDELRDYNFETMKRANDNAGGSLLVRGILGQLNPATPRMWLREQEQAAEYWATRDIAREAQLTGSKNYASILKGANIHSVQDMHRYSQLIEAWMQDGTGDAAKVFLTKSNPALMPFTMGKSYWGPLGPPPESRGFDNWIDDLEKGDRAPFAPEVFMARYQRASIATDKEIAIIDKYGNDPDGSALQILENGYEYNELVDGFDMRYEAVEFLDKYLYDSQYSRWRTKSIDDLTAYELVTERINRVKATMDDLNDMLLYSDLTLAQRREVSQSLNVAIRQHQDAVRERNQMGDGDKTYLNPREQVLDRYWTQVSNPYYQQREELFSLLDLAENETEQSLVFDAVRKLNNQWHYDIQTIRGYSGVIMRVPSPQERAWGAKSQEERQLLLLKNVTKNPQWLDAFEIEMLNKESWKVPQYLPVTVRQQDLYDQAAEQRYNIVEFARQNPDQMTGSQRDKLLRAVDDSLRQTLIDLGRGGEVRYLDAVPIQRLAMLDMLPSSLSKIADTTNTIISTLQSAGKSPQSEMGRKMFLGYQDYLDNTFFPRNPQASYDFDQLGLIMFDEPLRAAVYARLLQGNNFGELK